MPHPISPLQREVAAAAVAGLLSGVLLAGAMQEQDLAAEVYGLGGAAASTAGTALHLALSGVAGAAAGPSGPNWCSPSIC